MNKREYSKKAATCKLKKIKIDLLVYSKLSTAQHLQVVVHTQHGESLKSW